MSCWYTNKLSTFHDTVYMTCHTEARMCLSRMYLFCRSRCCWQTTFTTASPWWRKTCTLGRVPPNVCPTPSPPSALYEPPSWAPLPTSGTHPSWYTVHSLHPPLWRAGDFWQLQPWSEVMLPIHVAQQWLIWWQVSCDVFSNLSDCNT